MADKNNLSGNQDTLKPCVLVAVTGCIAAYKACEVVRGFQKAGCRVKVLMSEHATHFVGPTTFRALTHEKVAVGLFDDPEDPIHHISLAKEADLIVVAPATANIIAKMAHGIADDLISTTLLAAASPILVAPAMNSGMWKAAATQENMATLHRRGIVVAGPDSGYLACGDIDEGRLTTPENIVEMGLTLLNRGDGNPPKTTISANDSHHAGLLAGKRVVITAGPTYEPIDPVRFIGNRSSGKMGLALAQEVLNQGGTVELICGPIALTPPAGAHTIPVETADEMYEAALNAFSDADIAICAAAVSDYKPVQAADHKRKKAIDPLDSLKLTETRDILAALSNDKGTRFVLGFAAETNDVVEYAKSKLAQKGCDMIVANDVSRDDSTFGSDTDKAWFITANEVQELPILSKEQLAHEIIAKISLALLQRVE